MDYMEEQEGFVGKMKGWLVSLLLVAMILAAGCQGSASSESELTVFAAASLTEVLTELGAAYEAENPGVKVLFSFDSSGTLKTQLEEGAKADVFIAASVKPMDELDGSRGRAENPKGLDLIAPDTRLDLLENRVVLVVPAGNPAGVGSFEDLKSGLLNGDILLAMGNSDVPVGQYSQSLLAFFGLEEEALARQGLITYSSNVKEVTTQVSEGAVDSGIIYSTDATQAGLQVVAEADEAMVGRVVYPAAVLKDAKDPAAARSFLAFLQTQAAREVFAEAGFKPVP